MKVKAPMAGKPGFDPRMLVRRIIVGDQVQFQSGRDTTVEVIEKGQELLVPVARFALRDDVPIKDVKRGKERSGAVAVVIMGKR